MMGTATRDAAAAPAAGGLFAYLLTPYDAQENVDAGALRRCVEALQESGIAGLTCLASTTDGPFLDDREHVAVLDTIAEVRAPGIGLTVGVGAASTRQAIERGLRARERGASSLILEVQPYFPLVEAAIEDHYGEVGERVGLPIRIYNLPGAGRPDFDPELIGRLSRLPGVTSVKDASGDADRIRQIRALARAGTVIHCGLHFQLLDGMRLGADGWEVALHPGFAAPMVELYRRVREDPWGAEAADRFQAWVPLLRLFRQWGVPQCVRTIAGETGLALGAARRPQRMLDAPRRQAVLDAYRRAMQPRGH